MRALLFALLLAGVLVSGALFFMADSSGRSRGREVLAEEEAPLEIELDRSALVSESSGERESPEGFVPEVFADMPPRLEPVPAGIGRLRIRISGSVDQEGQLPMVRLVIMSAGQGDDLDVRFLDLSKGSERNAVLSDPVGNAVLEVESGRDWILLAWEENSGEGRLEIPIPAFKKGELRDLKIDWDSTPGQEWVGRIIDGGSHAALGGAEVQLISAGVGLSAALSSRYGRFSLFEEKQTNCYLRIQAEGYTTRFLDADGFSNLEANLDLDEEELFGLVQKQLEAIGTLEEADANDYMKSLPASNGSSKRKPKAAPLDVPMIFDCSLKVSVLGEDQVPAPEGLSIEVVVDLEAWLGGLALRVDLEAEALRFEGKLDEQGQCLFSGLPADAPLRVQVQAPLQGQSEWLRIAPGTESELSMTWETVLPGKISGVLQDLRGKPLAGQEIWLVSSPAASRYFDCGELVVESVVSNKKGEFTFKELLPGAYLAGPSPACAGDAGERKQASANALGVAGVGTALVVQAGTTLRLPLKLATGEYLRGRVVDGQGLALPSATIETRTPDWGGSPPQLRKAESFVIGPLVHAAHDLQAKTEEANSSSKWLRSLPDDEEHMLRVFPLTGEIRGVVWDGVADEPVYAWVQLIPKGEALFDSQGELSTAENGVQALTQEDTGFFRFPNLKPGEYSLIALAVAPSGIAVRKRMGTVQSIRTSVPLLVPLSSQNGSVEGLRLTLQDPAHMGMKRLRSYRSERLVEIWFQGSLLQLVPWEHNEILRLPPGKAVFVVGREGGRAGRHIEVIFESNEIKVIRF